MKKLIPSIKIITLAMLLSACSPINSLKPFDRHEAALVLKDTYTMKPTKQIIAFANNKTLDWQRIDESQQTLGSPISLVSENQSIRTRISAYIHTPYINANDMAVEAIHQAKEDCEKVEVSQFTQNIAEAFYWFNASGCRNAYNHVEIGRAMKGADAVYLVYYTTYTSKVTETEINKLAGVIKTARLIANPRYHSHLQS